MTTPAEPANGSTITAAMFDASCSAIRSSSSSASSAPVFGMPRVNAWSRGSASCVCGRWSASTRLAERLAVADDAADRDAAEVDAVIALLAADQARLRALALRAPVRARHLERRVGGLGARAGEEHVVEAGGRELLDLVRELERQRVAELERRRVVERRDLLLHGLGDLAARRGRGRSTTGPRGRRRPCLPSASV